MKNITLLMLVLSGGLGFAQIDVSGALVEVAAGGTHELSGWIKFHVSQDLFPDVSSEDPVYIQFKFENGVQLADTLVDPLSPDPALRQPVFLVIWSNSNRVLAPSTTAALVEWRAGQNDLWIRIQSSTSNWLEINGQASPPDRNNRVTFSIGNPSEIEVMSLPENASWKNLPFNTRNSNLPSDTSSLAEAIDTLLCVDLSKSDRVQGSVVKFDPVVYQQDAKTPSGLHEPGTPTAIWVDGGNNALVLNRSCTVGCQEVLPEILMTSDSQWHIQQQNLRFSSGCLEGSDYLPGGRLVGPSSGLRLTVSGDSFGFGEHSLSFVDPPIEGVFSLEDPFLSGDRMLYRTAHLGWPEIAELPDVFGVDFQLEINGDMPPEDLVVLWDIEVENGACPNSETSLGRQTVHIARPAQLQGTTLIPHLTRIDGGFVTNLILTNPSDSLARFHLSSFSDDGSSLSSIPLSLEPGQTVRSTVPQLLGPGEHAYLSIPFQEKGTVLAEYRADREEATPAQVLPGALSALDFRFFAGDGILSWDGLALINGGSETTTVMISQKDFTGQTLAVHSSDPLAPGSKMLYLPVTDFNLQENTFFDIHADQPLFMIGLRGDLASDFLWENKVIAVLESTLESEVVTLPRK